MTEQITAYESIDLDDRSPAIQDLMSRAQDEARNPHIILSDDRDAASANLTPEMLNWYRKHVASERGHAMDSVDALLSSGDRNNGNLSFTRREKDRQKHDALVRKHEVLMKHRDRHMSGYTELERVSLDEEKARLDFENICADHNRQPREWSKWLYLPLLMLVGLAELAIYWEAFLAIENFTPAIATGTSLVIGLALAFSSHLFGMTLRQFKALFGADVDDIDRFSGWKMFGLSGVTLSIALGAVAYARFAYFQQSAMDFAGPETSLAKMVGGSMVSNVLVWVVGVLIAYMAHDPDPEFPRKQHHLLKVSANRQRLH